MNNINLNTLPLQQDAIIETLNCNDNIRRRFLDLGLIKGTTITPIFISPSGDPTAYQVRGSVIAIRKEDSCNISVKPII